MGAASASSQNSAMPQSQGKGGNAPTGGSGAPTGGGKGFANQQPYFPEGGVRMQGNTDLPPPELVNQSTDANSQSARPQGKGGASQGNPGEPQLQNGGQQGWQYGQGAGDRVTYPTTSGQQQFGQPMQNATGSAPYSNTIQSNQSSGKGKGA